MATMLLGIGASVLADVTARVDRDRVELNESFTLEITTDSNIDTEPDISQLEKDFYVGQRRDLSNTTIVNGQIRRSRSWSYSMMARRAGTLTVPPVTVGNESSQPLQLVVTEPTYQPPGQAEVFITAEVDSEESYVQAQVLYRIKVYRAVATRQPTLREPTFDGAEVLIEPAGDETQYEAKLGGKAYNVVERVYAVFPQESGVVNISPALFEARVLRNGRITGRKVFASEAQSITVNPIPAAPAEFPDATWLPARELKLSEQWSTQPENLTAGEPVTRNVIVSALGQLETQIPVVEPPETAGINVYPDKPELSRRIESGGIRGVRKDQYALIGVDHGDIELPMLELPWFNLDTNDWEVARLPARTISVEMPSDLFASLQEEQPEVLDNTSGAQTVVTVQSPFWRRISEVLGAAWALTLIAWWWSSRPSREEKAPSEPPLHKQQARSLKDARKAALAGDAAGLKAAMLDWGRLQWPDNAPRSIGDLAMRVSSPLSDELQSLSRSTYGAPGADWDGDAMAKAIRSFGILPEASKSADGEILPPLMPQS